MFLAKFYSVGTLRKIIESIKDLVEEAVFSCTSLGIKVQAMDTAHVSLISLFIHRKCCNTYKCESDIKLGIKIETLYKILKTASSDDPVELIADKETTQLKLTIGKAKKIGKYSLNLIDIEYTELSVEKKNYNTIITMPTSELQRVCKDLQQIGELVEINCKDQDLTFTVIGDAATGTLSAEVDNIIYAVNHTETKQLFAIKYLVAFTKGIQLSKTVKIYMLEGDPIKIEYYGKFETETKKKSVMIENQPQFEEESELSFYLAPRII